MKLRILTVLVSIVFLTGCGGGGGSTPEPVVNTPAALEIGSLSYNKGSIITKKNICSDLDGDNRSPQYSFFNTPSDTNSYALIMDDETSPCGTGDSACKHWSLYNIPSTRYNLDENVIVQAPLTEGLTYNSEIDYAGPCPSSNHTYKTTVYALKTGMPTIASGVSLTRSEFSTTYADYIIDSATMTGTRAPDSTALPEFTSDATLFVDEYDTGVNQYLRASGDSTITYSLVSLPDSGYFNLDGLNGVLSLKTAQVYNKTDDRLNTFLLTFKATDEDSNEVTQDATVVVQNVSTVRLPDNTSIAPSSEGNTNTYSVVLDDEPISDVTVTINSRDTAVATVVTETLTFTTANWDRPQSVTIMGVEDDNTDNDSVTFDHNISGGGYTVTVGFALVMTIHDND